MATTSATQATGQQTTTGATNSASNAAAKDAFDSLDTSTFIKMLVAELQNQDPMNPMDNQQILQEVSQIDQIQASQKLTNTLDSVLLGQSLSTASGLLNRTITGLDANNQNVTGVVDRVTIEDGNPILHIGDQQIQLKNVTEIDPTAST